VKFVDNLGRVSTLRIVDDGLIWGTPGLGEQRCQRLGINNGPKDGQFTVAGPLGPPFIVTGPPPGWQQRQLMQALAGMAKACSVALEGEALPQLRELQPEEAAAPRQPEPAEWPAEGDLVEARYHTGVWQEATVAELRHRVDWYAGRKVLECYVLNWSNGDTQDREKQKDEIRPTKERSGYDLEDLPRHAAAAVDAEDCLALCSEAPRRALVVYERAVGEEIQGFALDPSCPLTPLSVEGFAGPGPAQEQGVEVGWYLDVAGTILGPSSEALAGLIDGLAGTSASELVAAGSGKVLDAIFANLPEVLGRLNRELGALTGVTMVFTNSSSPQKAKLLPEAVVRYGPQQRVGSEVRQFTTASGVAQAPGCPWSSPWGFISAPAAAEEVVRPDGFLQRGPAQEAGVRADWVLDIQRTLDLNPGRQAELQEEMLRKNPNALLVLSDLALAFRQPEPRPSQQFKGWGPPDSEQWKCKELPGSVARFHFQTDGDSSGEPEERWGFWAVVLPSDAPRPSAQALDALAAKWVDATTKARGVQQELQVERDEWDETRLRALCERHGWDFEWISEDSERRRRANERQSFFAASSQLAGAREAAKAAAAARAPA